MQQYVARQPIFDRNLQIYAYELLFRSGAVQSFGEWDPDKATSAVLSNSIFLMGLETVTNGKLALINFSDKLLSSDIITLLPRDSVAIEILETVRPGKELLACCERLKAAGFIIALDDFVYQPEYDEVLELTDIVKVDFLQSDAAYCAAMPKRLRGNPVFLAEKIETYAQFKQAVSWGYSLFQGYFFCKPHLLDARDIPGNKMICFRLLKELHDARIGAKELAGLIQKDVSLSFKLLKYVNSASVGLRVQIESIRQAVALLGKEKLVKFVSLLLIQGMGNDKPSELTVAAIIRGRFAELIALHQGLPQQAASAFLVGMFSLLDALLDRPLPDILAELPVNEEIKMALKTKTGVLDSILRTVIAYEQGDWEQYEVLRTAINLEERAGINMYLEAVAWAGAIEG